MRDDSSVRARRLRLSSAICRLEDVFVKMDVETAAVRSRCPALHNPGWQTAPNGGVAVRRT
jgi:hypothetical protein